MEDMIGEMERDQICKTQWAMLMSYSKYKGKLLKVSKSLYAICLLKRSLDIWRVDWRGLIRRAG